MATEAGRSGCVGDRGRTAVYAAEDAAFGGTLLEEARALADLQERARMIIDGDWWRQAGGSAVDIIAARGTARSSSARHDGRHAVIRLAATQHDEVTIAHELAHLLAGISHGHDGRFRAAHLDLIAMLSGPRAALMLSEAYAAFGLSAGRRAWPAPVRVSGSTFVIVP